MACGKQKWDVRFEVELGFAGKWDKEELLECLRNAIEGQDGLEVIDAKERGTVEVPCD